MVASSSLTKHSYLVYRFSTMNKFQPIRFSSVNELLDHLPPDELKTVERLQNLVLECIPDAKEKLSYNVPY